MALYKRVAHVYVNKRILDIETPELNPNSRDTIAELVRDELLMGQPTEELESLLESKKYLNKIFRAIDPAYNYLRSRGIEIYKLQYPGKRNLHCITTVRDYKDAKEREVQRIIRRADQHAKSAAKNLRIVDPGRMTELSQRIRNTIERPAIDFQS